MRPQGAGDSHPKADEEQSRISPPEVRQVANSVTPSLANDNRPSLVKDIILTAIKSAAIHGNVDVTQIAEILESRVEKLIVEQMQISHVESATTNHIDSIDAEHIQQLVVENIGQLNLNVTVRDALRETIINALTEALPRLLHDFQSTLNPQHKSSDTQPMSNTQNIPDAVTRNSSSAAQQRIIPPQQTVHQSDERINVILARYMVHHPKPSLNDFFNAHFPHYLTSTMKANCECLDLSGQDLSGANFSHANFRFSTFTGANLKKVDLTGTLLDGADITNVQHLKSKQLAVASYQSVIVQPHDTRYNYKRVKKADNLKKEKQLTLLREKVSKLELFINLITGHEAADAIEALNKMPRDKLHQLKRLVTPTFEAEIQSIVYQVTKSETLSVSSG